MWKELVLVLVLFSLVIKNSSPSSNPPDNRCYFDGNKKLVTEFGGLTTENCTFINDTDSTPGSDDGCNDSRHPDFQLGSEQETFELSIGVGKSKSEKIIVLNVTISNITFHNLSIRHQNLGGNKEIYSQTINFEKDRLPDKLFVFSSAYEFHRTKIQFFAEGSGNKFFKEYHFIPNSTLTTREDSSIFAYVDTTFRDRVYLHVQPHNNITRYMVEFHPENEKRGNFCGSHAVNLSTDDFPYRETNFPENGNYKFCLLPIDSNGKNYNAIHVGSFCMRKSLKTLLETILGFGAIPVLIFFSSYILYIWFRKKVLEWLKERKPGCLLVYSATHDAHIDVMIKLAEYLNECDINAMIDVLDIPYEAHKNPCHWFDSAFQKANTVVVIASPECKNAIVAKTIYKSLDNYAMKLIHENRRHRNKRYLAVQLPYCKGSEVPKEAEAFRLLKIPKDLKILVNKIHHTTYTKVYKTPDERKLIKCIESARRSIMQGESIGKSKSVENFTDTIFSRVSATAIDVDQKEEGDENYHIAIVDDENKAGETEYATNIRDLNLLGDKKAE